MDERIQDASRRAAAGSEEAQAELLLLRLRAGDLTEAGLEAAARLGYAPARRALGRFVPIADAAGIDRWRADWDREACLRVALYLARTTAERQPTPDVKAALASAERALEAPGRFDPEAARRDHAGVLAEPDLPLWQQPWEARCARAALRCSLAVDDAAARQALGEVLLEGGGERDFVRALREVLVPWALRSGPPPCLPPATAIASYLEGFRAELREPGTETRAQELRRRLRARALEPERVTFAALLGDPAAWTVAEPEERDPLSPPERPALIENWLGRALRKFAKPLPPAERKRLMALQERRDPEREPEEPGPVWPAWSRDLFARLALVLAERSLRRYQELRGASPLLAEALEAGRALPVGADATRAQELAAAAVEAEAGDAPEALCAAAQAVGWAVSISIRTRENARTPRLSYSRENPLERAQAAGIAPAELCELLRATAIAWALRESGPEQATPARAYSAREAFHEGEAVQHATFGAGSVLQVRGNTIQVEFPGHGIKNLRHAPGGQGG